MLEALLGLAALLGTNVVTGIVWGVRLEGKVKVQEQRVDDLKELIISKFDEQNRRLGRIERSLNGALRHD